MPSCPGCGEAVAYAELSSHVRTCKWIWSEAPQHESLHVDHLVREIRRLEWRVHRTTDSEPISEGADDEGGPGSSDRRE